MPQRFPHLLSLLFAAWGACGTARAAPPGDSSAETAPTTTQRRRVVVGVAGPLDPDARSTLVRLLRAELEPHGLAIVEMDPTGEARDWARGVTSGDEHLLGVLLDTKSGPGWRLVLVDAARGRGTSRELPRGERDAANVEAVVSIVVSATNALREGLEVASAPLESVVEPERAPAPAPPPKPAPAPPPPPRPEPSRGTTLHASLMLLGASFAEEAEPTFGASLGFGAAVASLVDVDLGVARHLPVDVESPLGSFDLERTSLGLSAGPVLGNEAFVVVPSLGVAGEWIHRSETLAADGVATESDAETIFRLGGTLDARARYRLVSNGDGELLSLVAGVGAAYFGDRVRFLAGDELLVEAPRASFHAELGLFIATDPL